MGLLQNAYDTYCAMERRTGEYETGKQPLAPVSHTVTAAQIEISLDQDGKFLSAMAVDKESGKIIIPVTQESANRTRKLAAHPLCEQIGYLCESNTEKYELYLTQLERWNASPWSHPKLKPVLVYVKSNHILPDLVRCGLVTLDAKGKPEKDKQMICWRIVDPGSSTPPECWKDKTLFQAFIDYYRNTCEMPEDFCMISGEVAALSEGNPKGVVALYGNAKIISSNDDRGFTYRGRFENSRQAATVGYDVSQKAHSALRWLVANQGVIVGGRVFLCWNPQGVMMQQAISPLRRKSESPIYRPSDYRQDLQRTILGEREHLPPDAKTVIVAFDAANTGRLSVTYYGELAASDFIQRLHDWDINCCWYHWYGAIEAPRLKSIVDCAYGVQRKQKERYYFATDDAILGQQLQRLLACRVSCARMPKDILHRLFDRVSNPMSYDESLWNELLFVTCAVIQKYYAPKLKEDLCMDWELNRKDYSFQYGRLLAIMDWVEAAYYKKVKEERQTNAMKSLSVFRKTPLRISEQVNAKLENAYLPRLSGPKREQYDSLRNEIIANLCQCCTDLNAPLNEYYLIGYSLQKNALAKKNNPGEDLTENEEE